MSTNRFVLCLVQKKIEPFLACMNVRYHQWSENGITAHTQMFERALDLLPPLTPIEVVMYASKVKRGEIYQTIAHHDMSKYGLWKTDGRGN